MAHRGRGVDQASPDHFMTHLTIWDGLAQGEDGPETEWGEQFTDAEYGQSTL